MKKWLYAFAGVFNLLYLGMWVAGKVQISNFMIGLYGFTFVADCFIKYYLHHRSEILYEQLLNNKDFQDLMKQVKNKEQK